MSEVTTGTETKTETKKPSRFSNYALLAGSVVASWFVLPVAAAVVSAAPLIVGAAAVGGAAYVASKKPLREKTLGFFKKVGGLYAEALKQVGTDWRLATTWANEKAAQQKLKVAANDEGTPSKLGSKESANDFNASADADEPKVKAKKPAPKPAPIHKIGM